VYSSAVQTHIGTTWIPRDIGAAASHRRVSVSRDLSSTTSVFLPPTMDSFENFQYDSASSYGGMGIVDDTSSVYTVNTSQSNVPLDLDSLSITDDRSVVTSPDSHVHHSHPQYTARDTIDEEFDAVLDDLKDEGQVDLPPHACR
jgi:hypothetical protein